MLFFILRRIIYAVFGNNQLTFTQTLEDFRNKLHKVCLAD